MRPSDKPSPVHRVVVYYQTQYPEINIDWKLDFLMMKMTKYLSPIPLIGLASHLIVSAFHLDGNDNIIYLNKDPPHHASYVRMWRDIARMQGSGVKVIGMLGGASDSSFKNLKDNFGDWYKKLLECIKEYRLDGFDLAIKEKVDLDVVVKLIQNLRANFGVDFIITLAPVASALMGGEDSVSGLTYSDIESSYGDQIDWYNVQFYLDSTTTASQDTIATVYTDIVDKCPLDPGQMVISTTTALLYKPGFTKLDVVRTNVGELLQKYGHCFGGIAGWEYANSMPDRTVYWTWAAQMKAVMDNWKASR
ncbi:glycoside hydrolase family 18 protein [Collybiopsis luxurians FD-317 M1]|uniref:Unplaced genomic scaffold GYMLUscaffold_76, whole genome shotgun sequence n=1 Tax=Collybiopsis luxurians FD-317 M1 TaxID=944289 RepID=A0A0D0C7A2_9AGAR|nr:glycoside hydrolase family 18 protein [Collybiopsis luxurians FD-317 M1]